MGRKATVNHNLPKSIRARKRQRKNGAVVIYYFYESRDLNGHRKEIPLGTDYLNAVRQWTRLEMEKIPKSQRITFPHAAARYKKEILPRKQPKTARENQYQLNKLLEFFGGANPAPLDEIQAQHINIYFKWRKNAPVAANREIALFSHIWTLCGPAEWGYTDRPNPAKGIKRHTEKPRDTYIEDYLYQILYECADPDTRDIMDTAYMIGQRPADVLKIQTHHIRDGILSVKQNKTQAQLRFTVSGSLKAIIDKRIKPTSPYLFSNKRGQTLTVNAMGKRFAKIRRAAIAKHPELEEELKQCQFRDLRAKSGTDKYLSADSLETAQQQLGHTDTKMTKRYIRRDKAIQPLEPKNK